MGKLLKFKPKKQADGKAIAKSVAAYYDKAEKAAIKKELEKKDDD